MTALFPLAAEGGAAVDDSDSGTSESCSFLRERVSVSAAEAAASLCGGGEICECCEP